MYLRRCLLLLVFSFPLALGADVLVPVDATWKYLPGRVEASAGDLARWRTVGFDDSSWLSGQAPFYYEEQPTSATAFTGNTVLGDMRGNYTCVFLRKSFAVGDPHDVRGLQLACLSDDGFIAWINGREVARFNMPEGDLMFDGTSLAALPEPISPVTTTLDQGDLPLVAGENMLAVQAFNSSIGSSSDFVISVSLTSTVDDETPIVKELIPSDHALVPRLTQVEVIFSEDVAGVDAQDLLINGQPANGVTAFNGSQYLFEFTPPPNGPVTCQWIANHGIHDLSARANVFPGGNWTYTLDPNAAPPGLMISEFMADNKKTLHDDDGDSSDWIELFNAGTTTANLLGYFLTASTNTWSWRFPNVSILPNSYLIVFASGKNRTNSAAPLHTDFKLNKDGGDLALVDPGGVVVSAFHTYPAQLQDVSYGRDRANPTLTAFFPTPTPGAANSGGGPGFSTPVQYSRPGSTFVEPFALQLTSADPKAAIHYTLDGTLPSEASPVYTDPLLISATVQVRSRSYTAGLLPGAPRSETYLAFSNNVTSFSSDLPVIVVHNFGQGTVPAGTRQFANISVYDPGGGRTSLTNAPVLSTRAGINLRGSSTLFQPKPNLRVEFWNDFDDPQDWPLLGMPEDNDWVLYACNNFDPVLIHNPFAHELSRQIGRYSPRTRFVELYLNTGGGPVSKANYYGVYVLLEKIKRGKDRVDIAKLEPEHTRPPQVTGGYLLSVDRGASGEGQIYASGLGINALSPSWDELTQPQRAAQVNYITSFLDTLYNVVNSPGFANPATGYAQYIDVPAALDHHILNVLTFNVDALRLSAYFYKPRDGKLTFGPLWDFDRALGSTDGRDSNPRIWRSASGDRGTDFFNSDSIFSNPWYSRMFQDIDFWQKWIDRWQQLRRQEFSLTNLHALVDTLASQVREAEVREVQRWPSLTTPRGGSYQAEVDRMKTWLSNRVDFIDTNFLAAPLFASPPGPVAVGSSLTLSAPEGATIYYTLDGSDPRAPGGDVAAGAFIYSTPLVLNQNVRVVARARDLNHRNLSGPNRPPLSSPWSGPVAGTFVVSKPPLLVTEMMYHPTGAAGGTNEADAFEFIELRNVGSAPLSLVGFRFTRGISYTFTNAGPLTTLAPGQYAVLVKNTAAFASRYAGVTVAGEYAGNLDNSGERITLEGPLQETIQDFVFVPAWAPSTDGAGSSLVATTEDLTVSDWGTPARWRAGQVLNGTPGQPEPGSDRPELGLIHVAHGLCTLQFEAKAGQSYSLLATASLSNATWQKLMDVPTRSSAGGVSFVDPVPVTGQARFYRVVTPALP